MTPQLIPKLEPVYKPRTPYMKRILIPLEEEHAPKFIQLVFFSAFHQKTYTFCQGNCSGEKEIIRPFGITGHWL